MNLFSNTCKQHNLSVGTDSFFIWFSFTDLKKIILVLSEVQKLSQRPLQCTKICWLYYSNGVLTVKKVELVIFCNFTLFLRESLLTFFMVKLKLESLDFYFSPISWFIERKKGRSFYRVFVSVCCFSGIL